VYFPNVCPWQARKVLARNSSSDKVKEVKVMLEVTGAKVAHKGSLV